MGAARGEAAASALGGRYGPGGTVAPSEFFVGLRGEAMSQTQLDPQSETHRLDPSHGEPEPTADSDDEPRRSVLGRVDCIIGAFVDTDGALSLQELTERTGLPKSTVHRMVDQMASIGWIEREVAGYRIGMRLFEVGGLASRHRHLSEVANPHLRALSVATGLPVQMGILDGTDVVYLERILVPGVQLPTRLGGRQPAYCTALGKAMLAYRPPHHSRGAGSGARRAHGHHPHHAAGHRDRVGAHRVERTGLRPPGVLRGVGVRRCPLAWQWTCHRCCIGHRARAADRPPRCRVTRPQHCDLHLERALPEKVSEHAGRGCGPAERYRFRARGRRVHTFSR